MYKVSPPFSIFYQQDRILAPSPPKKTTDPPDLKLGPPDQGPGGRRLDPRGRHLHDGRHGGAGNVDGGLWGEELLLGHAVPRVHVLHNKAPLEVDRVDRGAWGVRREM